MIRITPINQAEAFFLPFWDDELAPLSELDCDGFAQIWHGAQLAWDKASAGQCLGSISGSLDLDLGEYDQLMIMASHPKSTLLSVEVQIDGQAQTPIDRAAGIDNEEEYTGDIIGRHLQSIRIRVHAASDGGPASMYILWVGLLNQQRLAYMLDHMPVYDPMWEGLLVPEDAAIAIEPQRGLFFSDEELDRVREKVKRPPYRGYIDGMRERVRAFMAYPPEKVIGRHISRGGPDQFVRIRDRKPSPAVGARICSFIGLLDRDPELMRFGARCALSAAHCETWCTSPLEIFPGSRFHHRAFFEANYSMGCLFALDFAGSVLTDRAKRLIRYAICMKGLPQIYHDFWDWEYIWHCNQGPTFSSAWLLSLVAFAPEWPRVKPSLALAEQTLCECISNCISDDGGTVEGPGYGGIMARVESLYAYARYLNIPFRDYLRQVMPEKYFKSKDFMLAFLRHGEGISAGSYTTVCDSGGTARHSVGTMVMLAAAYDDPTFASIAWDLVDDPPPGDPFFNLEDVLVPVLGPEVRPDRKTQISPFIHFPIVQQLTSQRESELGPVHLFLLGGQAGAGHNHEDKGSFIIEADGELLAADRGMVVYYHPQRSFMQSTTAHNLLIPLMPDGRDGRQLNPCPHDMAPQGRGDARSFTGTIDTTRAWDGLFKKHVREIESESPTRFVITDRVEFEKPTAVTFNLHSGFAIDADANGWVIRGERAALRIATRWMSEESSVAVNGIDYLFKPVNHLRIRSKPIRQDVLVTDLEIVASDRGST